MTVQDWILAGRGGVRVRLRLSRMTARAGGRDRTRTCDRLGVNQVLFQLSYTPLRATAGIS